MQRRYTSLPRLWLMTDERIGDVVAAIAKLPRGAGIVFRHYSTPPRERRALFEAVRRIAQRRRLMLLLADTPKRARSWGADGAHHRSALPSQGMRSVAVHNGRDLRLAKRVRADLFFVSPVFATRSHPGGRSLGVGRLGLLAGSARGRTVALGGMTALKWRKVSALGLHGWAAIDALS